LWEGDQARAGIQTHSIFISGRLEERVALHADPFRIRYSVQCLLKNAVEAIDERRDRELDPEFDPAKSNDEVSVRLETPTSDRVVFSISDTGIGVPVENQERLFQPLFSTKRRPQKGGVGLFSVKRIIDRHGGRIDFNSEPGKGATFRVSLPTS
jgi:signal transduction histidine kinase